MHDYLYVDPHIDGQKFCLVSFIRKDTFFNPRIIGMKIRGTFNTKFEADQYSKHLSELEPTVDIFVTQVGLWTNVDKVATNKNDFDKGINELNMIMKKMGAPALAIANNSGSKIEYEYDHDDLFDSDESGNILAEDKSIDQDNIDINI